MLILKWKLENPYLVGYIDLLSSNFFEPLLRVQRSIFQYRIIPFRTSNGAPLIYFL